MLHFLVRLFFWGGGGGGGLTVGKASLVAWSGYKSDKIFRFFLFLDFYVTIIVT